MITATNHAAADLPPVRCEPATVLPRRVSLGHPGVVARIAAVRDSDRIVIAARMFLPSSVRESRIVVGELNPDGEWTIAPRVVARIPGHRDGALEVSARTGMRQVLFTVGHTLHAVTLGPDPEHDRIETLSCPMPGRRWTPVIAPNADGFLVVWSRPDTAVLQQLPLAPGPTDRPVTVRLPRRTMVTSAACGEDGTTALVVRTSARRFYIATVDARGRLSWPGTAPAGCDHGRCPSVTLLSAPGGYLAAWNARPTPDGLSVLCARPIDHHGHVRGRTVTFIPMVRGVPVVGPQGQALALQLGRPLILRGGMRPVAVLSPPDESPEMPVHARAWSVPSLGPGIEVLSCTRSGTIELAALRCHQERP